ncbi:hypothetical protein [Streptomyces sp. NPDC056405]|uniref:hypothetical protein n=1 Tax=Streptomyces sp. NPDC056405 TaxID=3345811 RepID=UPI0035E00CC5
MSIMELNDAGWFIGKVEFHPDDEKLWVYDTRNDGDTFYVAVGYSSGITVYDGAGRADHIAAARGTGGAVA